jgi:hypothetical protein
VTAVMACRSELGVWNHSGVSLEGRAVPRGLLQAARSSARRMAGANAAKKRAAPRQFKQAAHLTARRTAGVDGAKRRGVPRQLVMVARRTASRTEELGRRCQEEGCSKSAQGDTGYCKAHGGGRRCQHVGCSKSARGDTEHCVAHGGGRRCQHLGCPKAAAGGTPHCKAHGGGRPCQHVGCTKAAQTGGTQHCQAHGGGRRCQYEGCSKQVGSRRHATLRAAWRRQAVPARGLPQGTPRLSSRTAEHRGRWRVRGSAQASNLNVTPA